MIKLSKNIEWLRPFVNSVAHMVPLDKLKSIKGYRVQKNMEENQDGSLIKYGGKYFMTIRIQNVPKPPKDMHYKNIRYANLLDTLAHELAHLVHWEHTAEHFRLQAQILLQFSYLLDKVGIEDTSFRWNKKINEGRNC